MDRRRPGRDHQAVKIRWMIYGMLATVFCAAAGGLALMYSGLYNVAASSGHTAAVYWVLETGMRASVRSRAARVQVPATFSEAQLRKGAHCFDAKCAQCHGAPGTAPSDIGKGLLPVASSLAQTGRDWPVEEVYWVARHGIRMAGMPAWEFRLGDEELWGIAAFVQRELPSLSVADYRQRIAAAAGERCDAPSQRSPPDAARGLLTIRQYGCHGCHIIPGITGPEVHVGPSLQGFAARPLIAGSLPNTHANLLRWLRQPQALRPRTLMPDMGVTEQHAEDIRAYLVTLQ